MSQFDFVCVPSRWLETGPLVVLEAFAVGVPVLGTDRGGIAELVTHGVDGILVPDSSSIAWAETIGQLASDRSQAAGLRAGIRPPRTMADAASDMARLYRRLGISPVHAGNYTPAWCE
jgi:glycosyltransferase involved in cell wall biosynthesis